MKTNLIQRTNLSKYFLLLSFLLFGVISLNAVNSDSSACLEIRGRLQKLKDSESDFYMVELVYNGKVVDSMKVKDKREFKFKLNRNSVYGLRIVKKGYVPRYVSINTSLPAYANRFFRFEFDTELIPHEESKSLNKDALDFPIAIICFNNDLKCFYYDEEYTSSIKRRVYLGQEF
jgi:hypothetical protein